MTESALTHGRNLAHAASRMPHSTSPVRAPSNISVEDWDTLFRAVEERLRQMVGKRHAAADHSRLHDIRGSDDRTVLECVAALDQLHAALAHERERYHQLERDMRELQARNHRVSTL